MPKNHINTTLCSHITYDTSTEPKTVNC